MKKIFALLVSFAFISSIYSCKPREKCPAYGYQKTIKTADQDKG